MNTVSLDVKEWDKLNRDILYLAQETMPKETKKFMRREGGRLATATRKLARSTVHKKTGNYFNSIRGSKAWRNSRGGYGVYAYASRKNNLGNHAHLLEYGHKIVVKGTRTGKRTRDFRVFEKAAQSFDNKYYADTEAFIGKVIESGFTKGR